MSAEPTENSGLAPIEPPHMDDCLRVCRRHAALLLILVAGLFRPSTGAAQTRPASPIDVTDAVGRTAAARSAEEWEPRRLAIRAAFESVAGPIGRRDRTAPPAMMVLEEVDCGKYVRRLIEYESQPGGKVPAYLLVPRKLLDAEGTRAPAVLCLHPTDNTIGHKVVVGLGGKPNRQYAAELAERGFVTLSPSYPLLANYQPDLAKLGWESGTMKAIWDNVRGVDLLESLPFVERGKFGVIGHSLGGHNSVFAALFDERLKVVISSCGLDSFQDYYGGDEKVWMPEKGWAQTRYMPRLREYRGRLAEIPFDFPDLVAALAPRHVLIVAPLHDSNFRHDSVDRVAASARPVFALHGAEDHLQVEHPDCDHDFPEAMRQKAYELLAKQLSPP